MTWIGLRSATEAGLSMAGLGQPNPEHHLNPDMIVPRGSVLLQFSHAPQAQRLNLVRYAARDPWPAGLTLCIDPCGTLQLLLRQGATSQSFAVPTSIREQGEVVIVIYSWDAPARDGALSVYLPDRDLMFQTDVVAPAPLSLRDLGRIMTEGPECTLGHGVAFVAVSDRIIPAGPFGGIGGTARIDTLDGPCPVDRLRPGQVVRTADGGSARIVCVGAVDLPALGRFAPLILRAPYHGLSADIVVSPDQRMYLTGTDIEYLFGQEEVLAAIRHLRDDRSVLQPHPPAVTRYYQLVLDRHAIIRANGVALESLPPGPILADPAFLRHSVLASVPAALIPQGPALPYPVLRDFEAMTWRRLKAA